MNTTLIIVGFHLALLAGANVGLAQEKTDSNKVQELKKGDPSLPPPTGANQSAKAGAEEPSAKQHSAPHETAFYKGVLTAPGASNDVDTAPAKHWVKSDAADQIPIAGYRLRKLTPEQRHEIANELSSQREAPTASPAGGNYAVIGAEVPASIALQSLAAIPDGLADRFIELRGTGFMRTGGKLVIVDRDNNLVVGVLES
jgi:hypothetical protein